MNPILSFYKNIILCTFLVISTALSSQYIDVNHNYTNQQLVEDIFIGSGNIGCIQVSNVSFSGNSTANSYGYFSRNGSSFAMDEGIILTTGRATDAIGPNNRILGINGWSGDRDLERATSVRNTHDATILEFDFIAYQTNQISFDYIFASEQYLRNGDPGSCGYTDAFAFLIKEADTANPYTNLAVIPGTSTPITSNNVRGRDGRCPAENEYYFGKYNPYESPTNYNGETAILTATTNIVPGTKYHIKLVIADQGNGLYDSAVFLQAGSFNGNKNLGTDRLIRDRNALCHGETFTLDATTAGATYQWYKNGSPISGATNATYTVTNAGNYSVDIATGSCTLQGNIAIEYLPEIIVNEPTLYFCDSHFTGNYNVDFRNDVSPKIVANPMSYDIKYYLNRSDAENNNTNFLPNDWSFASDTSIFVRVKDGNCPPIIKEIHLKTKPKISLNPVTPTEICDNDLAGFVEVNLRDYQSLFTNLATATFYETKANAQNATNAITATQSLNADKTFYLRFENTTHCPEIGELKFFFKSPKKSETLADKTICENTTTTLDAGEGFSSYLWSNGETTQIVNNLPIGNYYVDLESNGCTYRQFVTISAAENPTITSVDVSGNTVTINATGGNPPYLYSINGENWVAENIFPNVARGTHSAFVKDTNNCAITVEPFIIINLINAITPNGDGVNDVLDYSDLKIKNNVSIEIYDRYGKTVYQAQNNHFIWDGTSGGRTVPSGTYWYILKWTEPATGEQKLYTNWILVKNR